MNQAVLGNIRLSLGLLRKIKKYKQVKIVMFLKFYYKLYSDDGFSSHYFEIFYFSNPSIVTYCQKVSLSQPHNS